MNWHKKNIAMLVGLLFMSLQMFGQYKISGHIKNHGGRILLLVQDATGKYDTLANSLTANGKFYFTGKVRRPIAAEIRAVNTRLRIPIFLEKGDYKVSADVKQLKVYEVAGGGKMQKLRNEFRKKELELQRECDSIRKEYEAEYGKDDYFSRLQIKGLLLRYEDLYDEAEDEFLKANDNIVSAALLAWRMERLMERKSLSKKYELLGMNARATVPGCYVKPFAEKIAALVVGGTAPDLRMQTPEGDSLSIYGVKAKAKIIDFWASWCGPCRASFPHLREMHKTYGEKVTFISLSVDKSEKDWQKALEEEKLPWNQYLATPELSKDTRTNYNLNSIPTFLVIDPRGKIIYSGSNSGELEIMLEKI